MICSNCKMRWADFPEEDYNINEHGITPKLPEAELKRKANFKSDQVECCPDCIEELNALYSRV